MDSPSSHKPRDSVVSSDDLSIVRSILLGPEQRKIATIERELDRPASASEVARVLPRSLKICAETESKALSDALFPIIGPAIRQAISRALRDLVDRINLVAAHSLSLRSWKWRLESIRTGRSFAEIALARSLSFQVEQVFLIHHQTGLLLAETGHSAMSDLNTVSGMLTAIMDFVRDSFARPEASQGDAALNEFKAGPRTVYLEESQGLLLAAVVTGVAPPSQVRDQLRSVLSQICDEHRSEILRFHGDASMFADARTHMDRCLIAASRNADPPLRLGSGLLFSGLLLLVFLATLWMTQQAILSRRVDRLLDRLRTEPGIVVVKEELRKGRHVLIGLRDPLAVAPETLLPEYSLSSREVGFVWSTYFAMDPQFVLHRAKQALRAPKPVEFQLTDGILTLSGRAPHRFLVEAERLASLVSGIDRVINRLEDEDQAALSSAQKHLLAATIHFDVGQHAIRPTEQDSLAAVTSSAITLYRAAKAMDEDVELLIVGHADPSGTESGNWELSRQRAEAVRGALLLHGVPASFCIAEGAGPVSWFPADQDPRAVSFVTRRKSDVR